jgi:hypothetical protein
MVEQRTFGDEEPFPDCLEAEVGVDEAEIAGQSVGVGGEQGLHTQRKPAGRDPPDVTQNVGGAGVVRLL